MGRKGNNTVGYKAVAAVLMMSTAVAGSVAGVLPAQAQTVDVSFSIAAGPLNEVLAQFGRQAGLQVTYQPSIAATKQSPGVSGRSSLQAAIARILAGSGLSYTFTNARTVAISQAGPVDASGVSDGSTSLETITIDGQNAWGTVDGVVATSNATGTKTGTPLLETPQSVSVITRDRIDRQGANRLDETLRYSAGVRSDYGGAVIAADNIFVRGQFANTYLDGLRNTPFSYFGIMAAEPYGLERVEVLKGPVSVLYGQNQPGGMINSISKRPTDYARGEVQTSFGTQNHKQVAVDVSGPLNEDGTILGRFVGLGRNADGNVEYTDDDRILIAPSLTFKPDEGTYLTILGSYQRNNALAVTNYPWAAVNGTSPFGIMPMDRFLGEPGFDMEKQEQANLGYEFYHEFNDDWSFKQNARYSNFDNNENYLARASGLLHSPVSGGDTAIARNWQLRHAYGDTVGIDNQLSGKFETGRFGHDLLVGFDYAWSQAVRNEKWGTGPRIENIFHPVYGSPIDFSTWNSWVNAKTTTSQFGLYVQDQIAYDNWRLTLGLRQDWVSAKVEDLWNGDTGTGGQPKSATALQDSDWSALTGRAGLSYVFDNGIAPYASYAESFNPMVGEDRFGNAFQPEESKQYEVGVKFQPDGWDGFFTVSAFDLRRVNVTTADPTDITKLAQIGEVRSRGLEFEASAQLGSGFTLIGSYTYLKSDVVKDTPQGTWDTQGKELIRVPNHMASLWLDYQVQDGPLEGLGVGGGVRYTGSSWGDALNTFKVPSYTLVDAALTYDFGKQNPELKGLTANLNVTNLFNKEYVASCFFTLACNMGEGRSVIGTLKYKW